MKILRFATAEDFEAMLKIYRPYVENTRISFEYETPSLGAFAERMKGISKKHPVIVLEDDGGILGYAYAADPFERAAYMWCAELSVYVDENCRGRGLGSALVAAVEKISAALGYRKMYSLVTEENTASIDFHLKVGYKKIAFFPEQGFKFGKWVGVVWLEKELNGGEVSKRFPPAISADERDFSQILNEAARGL